MVIFSHFFRHNEFSHSVIVPLIEGTQLQQDKTIKVAVLIEN